MKDAGEGRKEEREVRVRGRRDGMLLKNARDGEGRGEMRDDGKGVEGCWEGCWRRRVRERSKDAGEGTARCWEGCWGKGEEEIRIGMLGKARRGGGKDAEEKRGVRMLEAQ